MSDNVDVSPDGAVHRIEVPVAGPSVIDSASETVCSLFLLAMIGLTGSKMDTVVERVLAHLYQDCRAPEALAERVT